MTCNLTTAAAIWLANKTGASSSLILPRFHGRVGKQSVDDTGGFTVSSTITAVSWSALLKNDPHTFTAWAGVNVGEFIRVLLTRTYGDFPAPVRMDSLATFGTIHETQVAAAFGERLTEYADDYGLFIRDYRNGTPQIFTLAGRRSRAITAASTMMPISRSQALAPATWEQMNESYPRNHRIEYINWAGEIESRTWGDAADENRVVVEHDLGNIKVNATQVELLGESLRRREWSGAYSLPEVKIDLLMLLSSDREADVIQAGQILNLAPGDPVLFAYDWPFQVRGVVFAEGINETITADRWDVTLSLARYAHVVGEDTPAVKPRTWDQAGTTWDETPGRWDDY